jgi:hypothetical protein
MSLLPEGFEDKADGKPRDVVYLAKHPCYEVTLRKPALSSTAMSSEPPVAQLWFTSQPHRHGVVLTLKALEQFHEAVSRLLDYIEQECARQRRSSSQP